MERGAKILIGSVDRDRRLAITKGRGVGKGGRELLFRRRQGAKKRPQEADMENGPSYPYNRNGRLLLIGSKWGGIPLGGNRVLVKDQRTSIN